MEGCRDRATMNAEEEQGRPQPQSPRLSGGTGEVPVVAPASSHPEQCPTARASTKRFASLVGSSLYRS